MRVLLTGAGGNLGTTLRESPAIDFVPLGREDWSQLPILLSSGVDAVLHAAWDLRTPPARSPEAVFDSNLMTTMRILEACRDVGVPKFAFVSTCAVYGEAIETAEDAACAPVTINGITKLLNERVVEAFCAKNEIECQIYRVFNMYGGNDRFSILSHLRRALDESTPFTLNNGGAAQRDFIHVRDVARILLTLLPQQVAAVHVNIGTGRATRISDVVGAVQRLRPELQIAHQAVREAGYSRADTARLSSIVGELSFVDVREYVETELGPSPRPAP